ncbi:MAG: c-type cytochrome [Acidimicrobiia bacterium]
MLRRSVFLAVLVLSACTAAPDTFEVVEVEEQDPSLVELGEPLYQQHCAQCHGADLRGTDLGPSQLSIVYEPNHHGDAAFLAAVSRGSPAHHWDFGPMPPIPGLSQEDVAAITAFVREQQRINGFESYPP